MHRADVRDHPDLGPCDFAEGSDLAVPPHRELEDADLRVQLEAAQRQRHADLVVVARLGGDRARGGHAEGGEDVLRRRLAHRAGDADDAGGAPIADLPADACERGEGVVGHQRRGSPAFACLVEKLRATADGDEQVAGRDPARVDLHARETFGGAVYGAQRAQDSRLERDHAGAFRRRSASRTTSRSSNGCLRPAISWPCS